MSLIYSVECGKSFVHKGKAYRPPCKVVVNGLKDNNILKDELKKKGITNYKVASKDSHKKARKQVNLRGGDGSISLNSFVK
jgi:hypothetical protein